MFEEFVIVERKKNTSHIVVMMITAVLFGLLLLISLIAPIFMLAAIVSGILLYIQIFRMNIEYECSYFDGEVRFAVIKNKSKRKQLKSYSMEQVVQIAPAHDRSVINYERRKDVVKKNFTSHQKGVQYYEMVINTESGTMLVMFEPSQKYLDAVCVKYKQKVVMSTK
ncbi:DUF6106 family protein [Lachnobacterium bovis]|jgi:hypothetical protein|uniref:Uncharacterized protein n=1 Tax=Lachnobacterium bovis DSM 14045 TaxID=1122142 RepID=A0A1H3I0M4_9FIRM|nr:DUF6106 family protein [Lachnobacterium bovis]SDY21251.1 hypothetical protein SAMN02910414_01033 [Lachnobacterium bovis DSM 14045]